MGSYLDNGLIRLDEFFNEDFYKDIFKRLRRNYGERVKLADRYSYEKLDVMELDKIFNDKEFLNFINLISCENFNNCEINVKKFGVENYTLLHDSTGRKRMEFLLIFVDKWDDKFGGYIVYTDNEEKSLIFSVKGNSFILINKKGMKRFVKYVNHLAGKKNFFLVEGRLE